MMLWILLALLSFIYFIYSKRARKPLLLSPPAYPIIGSMFELMGVHDNLSRWIYERSVKFNFLPFEVTGFGGIHFLILQDGKQVEHMTKLNWTNYLNNDPNGRGFLEVGPEFWGRGIFMVDGDEWQTQRKAASHLFSLNALRNKMYHVFCDHARTLVTILRSHVGKEVDLQLLFQNFTFDAMCEIAFGVNPGALEGQVKPQFLADFDFAQQHVADRMLKPPFLFKAERFLGLGRDPEYQKACRRLTAYCSEIIQQRKQAGNLEDRGDLLSMFIAFGRQRNQPEILTDTYLRDVIINFLVAGRDTTAATLTHMFRALSETPAEQTKLTESLVPLSLDGEVKPVVEAIMKQGLLRNVMYETFRLYPAVPVMARFAIKNDTMPGDIPIRAGALCIVPMICMNRNPKVWPNPMEFTPSRWEDRELPSDFDFPGFWGGPRVCLGRVMAQTETMVAAGMLAKQFKFSISGQETFTMAQGSVWFYREGLRVRVELAN